MRLRSLILAGAVACSSMPLLAQAVPVPSPAQAAPPAAAQEAARDPIAPLPPAEGTAPVVEELPPPIWQPSDAQALLAYIMAIGSEGLDQRDYDPAGLVEALRSG